MQLQDMTNSTGLPNSMDMTREIQQEANLAISSISCKLTIVMPVRIDSDDRKANLQAVLSHISRLGCRVLVLEADSKPKLEQEAWMRSVEYLFIKDELPVFYRTHYINMLLRKAETDIVSVWDADILVSYEQVAEAISLIEQGCTIAYPYNGEYVMLSDKDSDMTRKAFDVEYLISRRMQSVFGRKFCGGVFFVHRERYFECGGENEHFTGWGPEDAERLRRVSILGHKVSWTNAGQAYHLNHPRGKNSDFYEEEAAIRLRKELCKVCSMDKEQLRNYLSL